MRLINREFPYFFFVLCSLFSGVPWSSIVLLLYAVMGVRKDRISVIFASLQGPISVRSGTFSVSEQKKKFKTLDDPRICSLHFTSKESDIEISLFGPKLSVRSDCCPTIFDPTKSTNPGRIRLVHVRSVLPIERDSVMNNRKPSKSAPKPRF